MKKAQVLLSSYNGEKYIGEQLESIFNQQGVEVYCLVRDDGSTDGTKSILHTYQQKYRNLNVSYENNIGFKASFMRLVELAGDYDYYAFADQDDVWKPEKLLKAIEHIDTQKEAVMYCSNCIVVDHNLEYIGMLYKDTYIVPSKVKALVQGFAYGCTIVFNHQSKKIVLKHKPKTVYSHDFWIPVILTFLGKVIYDKNSYIFYRQHGNNYYGSSRSIKEMLYIRYKNGSCFYSNMINEILNGYGDILKPEDHLLLKKIVNYKNSWYNKFQLLCNKELSRNTLRGTLLLRLMIIFSKF